MACKIFTFSVTQNRICNNQLYQCTSQRRYLYVIADIVSTYRWTPMKKGKKWINSIAYCVNKCLLKWNFCQQYPRLHLIFFLFQLCGFIFLFLHYFGIFFFHWYLKDKLSLLCIYNCIILSFVKWHKCFFKNNVNMYLINNKYYLLYDMSAKILQGSILWIIQRNQVSFGNNCCKDFMSQFCHYLSFSNMRRLCIFPSMH